VTAAVSPGSVAAEQRDEELASLAKALGHPARVRILRLLLARDSCYCGELVDELPLAQATVSQHLKVLKEAGVLRGPIENEPCYCLEPGALRWLAGYIAGLADAAELCVSSACCDGEDC
jgi:ArsR family transcriptional regulator